MIDAGIIIMLACWLGRIGDWDAVEDLLLVVGLPKMTNFDRKGHFTNCFCHYFLIFQFSVSFPPFVRCSQPRRRYIHDRNLDFIATSCNADASKQQVASYELQIPHSTTIVVPS